MPPPPLLHKVIFQLAFLHAWVRVPIIMYWLYQTIYLLCMNFTLSVSPQRNNARVIADSILNLNEKKLISNPRDDPHVTSELRTQGAPLESDVDFCPPMEQSEGVYTIVHLYMYLYSLYQRRLVTIVNYSSKFSL